MVAPDVVARKVATARARLAGAEALAARAREPGDVEARDLATFYIFLAIQEAIDLAAHWASDAGWEPADEAGAVFDVLAGHHAIDRDLADAMRRAVGLRNRIAHGYAAIDHERLFRELADGAGAIRRFLVAAATAAGL